MTKKRALILYTSVGSGHRIAGEALMSGFLSQGYDVKLEDIFNYSELKVNGITGKMIVRNKPLGSIYDYIWNQEFAVDIAARSTILRDNFRKVSDLIADYRPHIIVCTQAFTGFLASEFSSGIPICGVVTDFKVAPMWLASTLSHYFVPNLSSKIYLLGKGIDPDSISVSGIPLRPGFDLKSSPKMSKDMTRLNIFILAGGLNQTKYFTQKSTLVRQIRKISKNHQVTVVCGSNDVLKKSLMAIPSKNLNILGSVQNPADLMKKADLVITKPGGLICAESLSLGKPLLLIGVGYGQERGNVDYLTNNGAAVSIEKIEQISKAVKVIQTPGILEAMTRNAALIGEPNATETVVKTILNTYK